MKMIFKSFLCFVCILVSCKENKNESFILTNVIHDYVDYMKELNLLNDQILVKVSVDSSSQSYQGYRITTFPYLLEKNELPNKIYIYKGAKIALFTEGLMNQNEITQMTASLKQKGFYQRESAIGLMSNYPEWVVLQKNHQETYSIVKDQWYKPLSEIIESLDSR